MKKLLLPLLLFTLFLSTSYLVNAQKSFTRSDDMRKSIQETFSPFYHGIASGDPTQNSVILWTRITPESFDEDSLNVRWFIASDTSFTDIIQHGDFNTFADRDYTVKVDVQNLEPQTTYYYLFQFNGISSMTGRTRTASTTADHLRFAVASCSNYEHGYFNSYARISERNDLDAVIHLGDYIYEYGENPTALRTGLQPEAEILELMNYRTRYSFYRLDQDLMKMHQQHPIISVWDDHEVANDSWINGAQNHQADEGDYQERKTAAKQAYFEWMPIRDNEERSVYRSVNYGDLVELIMLDTRHQARDQQIDTLSQEALYEEGRTILGADQKAWLLDRLENSTAQWKILGNQVIFSPLAYQGLVDLVESLAVGLVADIWEGYPAERQEIFDFISENDVDNVVILTGDIHASFAVDVAGDLENYDPETGATSLAVEFITPSISSNNYDEYVGDGLTTILTNLLTTDNPHLKLIDLIEHGYFVLDVTEERVQADWFFDSDHLVANDTENYATSRFAVNGDNYLQSSEVASPEKTEQEAPAPSLSPIIIFVEDTIVVMDTTVITDTIVVVQDTTIYITDTVFIDTNTALSTVDNASLILLSAQYLEASSQLWMSFSLNEPSDFAISLMDLTGKVILEEKLQRSAGLYQLAIPTPSLPKGLYVLNIREANGMVSKKLMVW